MGRLDEAAYVEILAQAAATLNGVRTLRRGALRQGYLVGARELRIFGAAETGDRLQGDALRYGDFGIVKGAIVCGANILVRGEVKVWHGSEGAMPP